MKILVVALVLAVATAHPLRDMIKTVMPDHHLGDRNFIGGSGQQCFAAGPVNLCCAFDGAYATYGWRVNDTVLADSTYNVTYNPFATVQTGLGCDFSITQFAMISARSFCNIGYAHVPFQVLFNDNFNANSIFSYVEVTPGYCTFNVTSSFYRCIWEENIIGGDPCSFTPVQNHSDTTIAILQDYAYYQQLWPM